MRKNMLVEYLLSPFRGNVIYPLLPLQAPGYIFFPWDSEEYQWPERPATSGVSQYSHSELAETIAYEEALRLTPESEDEFFARLERNLLNSLGAGHLRPPLIPKSAAKTEEDANQDRRVPKDSIFYPYLE